MEAIGLQNDILLVDALGGTRVLLEVTPKLQAAYAEEVLERLTAKITGAIRLAQEVRDTYYAFLRLPDESQTDQQLRLGLVLLGRIAESLEDFAQFKDAGWLPNWLSACVGAMAQMADDFRDLEETFALGLSQPFKDEIEQAKNEAP